MTSSSQQKKWTAAQIPSQAGRRVLITGANSGIGFHTALELARKGAEVIVPARTQEKAEDAARRIRAEVPSAFIVPAILDLASQKSVRSIAKWFAERYPGPSIDLLINNAGVMAVPRRELTIDGFERQFATNFLGPFALTALLYGHVKQQAGSRIVTVSSAITKQAKLDFDNLQGERRYSPMNQAYAQSKLADSIFALELHRRLQHAGSPVIATSAHPGFAVTNLQKTGPGEGFSMLKVATTLLMPLMSQDSAHGALPTLYAAVAPEAQAGGYYGPNGLFEAIGFPKLVPIAKRALNEEDAKRLWETAERLTGTTFAL